MRIIFRQGIIAYPTSAGNQTFLTKTGAYVSLSISSTPVDIAFAHRDTDYLFSETASVSNAWGPITTSDVHWLYWDISLLDATRTFGMTTLEPVYGPTEPALPQPGQHWFDTTDKIQYVFQNGDWREVVRVFAGTVQNSTFQPLGVGFPLTPYAGSQVGIYTTSTPGRIISDSSGDPIRTSAGTFFTSESDFFINGSPINSLKFETSVLTGQALENMARYQVVKFSQFGKLNLAAYNDIGTTTIAIVLQDLMWDEVGTVCVQGTVTNPDWNWSTVGALLWVDGGNPGVLTEEDAHVLNALTYPTGKVPVARVITPTTIYFDQGLGQKGDKGDPGPPFTGAFADATNYGIVRLSTSPAVLSQPVAVGDNDIRLSNKVLKSGDVMTGPLILSGNPVVNLGAATKQYVDAAIGGVDLTSRVAKAGDTMTGLLTLSGDPTANLHAATKQYVDAPRRPPVQWADYPGINQPSTGTISLAGAPFNGAANVTVGDAILTVYPNVEADAGIWVVTSINVGLNTATVTRRVDTAVGRQMYAGEIIFATEQSKSYVLSYVEVDGDTAPTMTIGTTGHFAYFQVLMEYLTHNDVVGARNGLGVSFSQMSGVNPLSRSNGMYYINASSGNLAYTLPANANTYQDEDGHYFSFRMTIVRTDTSTNTLSFSPPAGQYLDGVQDGTVQIPPGGRVTFMNAQPDQWFVVGGQGLRQSVTPYTLTDAATVTMDWAYSNNFRLVMNVAGATRLLANPINMRDGQVVNIRISQDGVGGRTLTYGSKWKWANGTPPTLSAGPNSVNFFSVYYDGVLDIIIASSLTGLS